MPQSVCCSDAVYIRGGTHIGGRAADRFGGAVFAVPAGREEPRLDGGDQPGRRAWQAEGGRLSAKGSMGLQPNDLPHGL